MDGVLLYQSPVLWQVRRDLLDVQDGQPHPSKDMGWASTIWIKELYQYSPFIEDTVVYQVRPVFVINFEAQGLERPHSTILILGWSLGARLRLLVGHVGSWRLHDWKKWIENNNMLTFSSFSCLTIFLHKNGKHGKMISIENFTVKIFAQKFYIKF